MTRSKPIAGVLLVCALVALTVALTSCSSTGSTTAAGRVLLTYPSTGTSADALATGVLGSDAKGCVTIGSMVLVVPDGSTLAADGSIVIAGATYKVGTTIHLGGGAGNKPPESRCGTGQEYWWV